ncbi:MAG: hypothetical protein KatS3mg042_1807 [Rhodothermaceae bacterium]|nr:MAG: hypothetical protein KatS3mg042_1807 [Rhodothermaceae bacterium]
MSYRLLAVLLLLILLPPPPARSQTAPRAGTLIVDPVLVPYTLPILREERVDLGDYDGDGDLDLLLTGHNGQRPESRVFVAEDTLFTLTVGEQTTVHTFKRYRPIVAIIDPVYRGMSRWGDYDGDGDGDLLIAGIALVEVSVDRTEEQVITRLYRNQNGVFVEDTRPTFVPVYGGQAAWGDYDGDGDLDLVLAGATRLTPPFEPRTRLYRNDDGLLTDTGLDLPGLAFGDLAWGDYDGDGDLDLALLGATDRAYRTVILRNDGDTFTDIGAGLPGLAHGDLDWGDYDGDGDLDLLVVAGRLAPGLLRGFTRIYRNDGGTFSAVDPGLPDLAPALARWIDLDLDGDLDLLMSGRNGLLGDPVGAIYRNDNGTYLLDRTLPGLLFGDIAVGDYNGDGDPDYVLAGLSIASDRPALLFYMNRTIPEPLLPCLTDAMEVCTGL